jgi:predicted amidohydrolase YtcJ
VHRTTVDGRPPGGWLPDQRLSASEALSAYTAGAAYAGLQDERVGKLDPGMLADVVVLDQDIVRYPDRIMEMRAMLTVVGGRVAYERNSETSD